MEIFLAKTPKNFNLTIFSDFRKKIMDHSDDIFFQNWKREQNKIDNISLVIQSASSGISKVVSE